MDTPASSSSSRTPLIDITNDSPIVGLAVGSMKTPSSQSFKKGMFFNESTTPGSGEALLRDQVQTLLQKVEEEVVINKHAFQPRNFMNSPIYLLPSTPANTPQFSENNKDSSESFNVSPIVEQSFNFFQRLDQQEENEETSEKNVITKLLFADFPEKSKGYDSSLEEEDDESVWSVEANASTSDGHEEDDELEVDCEDLCERWW